MSGSQLEAWWGLSPEDLAIVQADPNFQKALSPTTTGTLVISMFQKLLPQEPQAVTMMAKFGSVSPPHYSFMPLPVC